MASDSHLEGKALILGVHQAGSTPVVHLDSLYYGPGWEPASPAHWEVLQRRLVAEDRWIVDGNYAGPSPFASRLLTRWWFWIFRRCCVAGELSAAGCSAVPGVRETSRTVCVSPSGEPILALVEAGKSDAEPV